MSGKKRRCAAWIILLALLFVTVLPDTALVKAAPDDTGSVGAVWQHLSDYEKDLGTVVYDETTGVMSFPAVDDGWSARMVNTQLDLSGKNWAVEFDTDLLGGELVVCPAYEDAVHFAGLGIDFGASVLDGIVYNEGMVDDFGYMSGYAGIVQAPGLSLKGRIKIEFRNGANGGLSGGTATVYQKKEGEVEYTNYGTYTFEDNIVDTAAPNRLLIQLRLGLGTVSNIAVTEITDSTPDPDNPGETKTWQHLSDYEKDLGTAVYDETTGVMSFPAVDEGWSARMVNTKLDLSGKNWAVEFDVDLQGGELVVCPAYEDAVHFAGLGIDFGASVLDGIVYNEGMVDDFGYMSGYAGIVPAPGLSLKGRIKIEFRNGANGGLSGGTATVYQKKDGEADYTKYGTYTFEDNIVDTAAPNRLLIQLRLGLGTVSNIAVTEITDSTPDPDNPGDPEENKIWKHISDYEKNMGTVTFDETTGTLNFQKPDDGWSARMVNTELDLFGKNWAVEFDVDLQGGELLVCPVYEDAVHFAGVGIDFGANILDGIVFNGELKDDFSYMSGFRDHYEQVPGLIKKGRMRVEFRNGANGSLSGGAAIVYQKADGEAEFVKLGTFGFDENVADTELPNRLLFQLRAGMGTVSGITVSPISDEIYVPEKPAKWAHINSAEEQLGYISYDEASDTMTLKDCIGWAGRLVNTEINDISGQNFAVEFDANLGNEGIIGIMPFYEDALKWYAVGYDMLGCRLDGVGIMGSKEDGTLNVIDELAYIDDTIYPAGGILVAPSIYGEDVRLRAEFFLGSGGTMAGGTACYYYKVKGSNTWKALGRFLLPDTIEDDPNVPNKLMIYGHLVNGTIKNIEVYQNITESLLPRSTASSEKWGYVSKREQISGTAYFSDSKDAMTLLYDAGWNSRMVSLTTDDVTGKAFALEFKADFASGGAIGIFPFYENEDNWYGIYLDRGGGLIDGVGFANGKMIDNFTYIDSTLHASVRALELPATGKFRMRFEYFPNQDGKANGATCKIFYRTVVGDQSRPWRFAGEFTIPDEVVDHENVKNRIAIHGRLMSGTLSAITVEEIAADTKTVYYQEGEYFETGYPDDSYTEGNAGVLKITEFGSAPWYSIAMIAGGCVLILAGAAILIIIIMKGKRKADCISTSNKL